MFSLHIDTAKTWRGGQNQVLLTVNGLRAMGQRAALVAHPDGELRKRAAEGLDLTPAQVALLWVRDAPGVTAPLLGARTAGQLQPYLDVEDTELPLPIAQALDDVSGGPHYGRGETGTA